MTLRDRLGAGADITAGYVRGRPSEWSDARGCHVFVDSKQPVPLAGGAERPCPFCGLTAETKGPDPCMGELPNVESACCGHGVHQGWIRFDGGPQLAVHIDYPGCWTPADAPLVALATGGVYHQEAPRGARPPYVLFEQVADPPDFDAAAAESCQRCSSPSQRAGLRTGEIAHPAGGVSAARAVPAGPPRGEIQR